MIYVEYHIAGSKWTVYINTFINDNMTVKYVLLLYSFVFILPLFIYALIYLKVKKSRQKLWLSIKQLIKLPARSYKR